MYTWIGVADDDESSTYSDKDYVGHEVYDFFKDIKTLGDLQANLNLVNKKIMSPTASYFDLNLGTGVFYRDQQDCVIWALEFETGRVYIWPDPGNDKSRRVYCAKSLPEFLSHVYADAKKWFIEEEGHYDN